MIVILNRDVKGTGKAGDIVKVSDGYARNMLLPKGYATEATEGNIRSLEKQKALMEQKKSRRKSRGSGNRQKAGRRQSSDQNKIGRGRKAFRLHYFQGYRRRRKGTGEDHHRQEKNPDQQSDKEYRQVYYRREALSGSRWTADRRSNRLIGEGK